jgi:Sulfotransferase family
VIISHRHRFIFVHLHKTAGDSICHALRPHLARTDFVLQSDFQAWVQKHTTRPPEAALGLRKHSSALAIRQKIDRDTWATYYKFAFVRHPFDRALSLYHFAAKKAEERRRLIPRNAWYLTPPGRKTDPLRWRTVEAYLETDSFSSFLRYPGLSEDVGMRPQIESLVDEAGTLLVDFIGRFERLSDDFRVVQDAIGVGSVTLGRRNASGNRDSQAELSREDRAFLSDRFMADMTAFSYSDCSAS